MTMHRGHDPAGLGLVADPGEVLRAVRDFVRNRGLVGDGNVCREVVRSFGDEYAFMDFSACRIGSSTRVLIEFGVKHGEDGHCVGFFDAEWYMHDANFSRIVAVCIDGMHTDLDGFSVCLMPYLALPLVTSEAVEVAV